MQGLSGTEAGRFLERVSWIASGSGCTRRVDRLPDGRTALVARVDEAGHGDVHLVGPRTLAMLKHARFARAWLVHFRPGCAAPLLGIPACELTDQYIALEDLWGSGARDLVADLLRAQTLQHALRRVVSAFAGRKRANWQPGSTLLARRAAHLLEHEDSRVDSVAERLGVTARHLRRAFSQSIGVAPKAFVRATRLQRAVGMMQQSNDWGRIAADTGYYDQAHLIADFRALIGLTPGAFARRMADSATR